MTNQPEKLPHEMTDEELVQHEADVSAAGARLFGGIEAQPTDDDEFTGDEDTDEHGDLWVHISPYDYRTLAEANAE
jgi:hypothetical protein